MLRESKCELPPGRGFRQHPVTPLPVGNQWKLPSIKPARNGNRASYLEWEELRTQRTRTETIKMEAWSVAAANLIFGFLVGSTNKAEPRLNMSTKTACPAWLGRSPDESKVEIASLACLQLGLSVSRDGKVTSRGTLCTEPSSFNTNHVERCIRTMPL